MTTPGGTLTMTAPKPSTAETPEPLERVMVWFGKHLIIDWEGPADKAPWMAESIQRRYPSLKVVKADGTDW